MILKLFYGLNQNMSLRPIIIEFKNPEPCLFHIRVKASYGIQCLNYSFQ